VCVVPGCRVAGQRRGECSPPPPRAEWGPMQCWRPPAARLHTDHMCTTHVHADERLQSQARRWQGAAPQSCAAVTGRRGAARETRSQGCHRYIRRHWGRARTPDQRSVPRVPGRGTGDPEGGCDTDELWVRSLSVRLPLSPPARLPAGTHDPARSGGNHAGHGCAAHEAILDRGTIQNGILSAGAVLPGRQPPLQGTQAARLPAIEVHRRAGGHQRCRPWSGRGIQHGHGQSDDLAGADAWSRHAARVARRPARDRLRLGGPQPRHGRPGVPGHQGPHGRAAGVCACARAAAGQGRGAPCWSAWPSMRPRPQQCAARLAPTTRAPQQAGRATTPPTPPRRSWASPKRIRRPAKQRPGCVGSGSCASRASCGCARTPTPSCPPAR
jgi:hypothetical protein